MPSLSGTSSHRGSGAPIAVTYAAQLAEVSYQAATNASIKPHLDRSIDDKDVQAHLLKNRILLIPGSNSAMDYLRFNVRLLNIGGKRYSVKNGATGTAIGRVWHQGFLAHAMHVYGAFKDTPPKLIIGHSLGAASAQILSLLWDVPAIGFATPRLYAGGTPVRNDRKCLCLWRGDDPVGTLPGHKFRHAGKSVRLGRSLSMGVLNHSMKHYRAAISDPNHKSVVPSVWPMS